MYSKRSWKGIHENFKNEKFESAYWNKKKVSFIYYSLSFFLYFGFQQTPSATGKWGRGWANGDRTPNSKLTNPLSHESKELSLALLSIFHNNSYLRL